MMVKVKAKVSGHCKIGSRHMKGRKGCWRKSKR
jgi:hypothetical protein